MVKESPDTLETTLLVTSRNKMYHSDEIIYHLNYGGVYADTSKFPLDADKNKSNIRAYNAFYEKIKILPGAFQNCEATRYMATGVSKYDIAHFIKQLSISHYNKKFEINGLSEYIENSDIFPYWDVVIASGSEEASEEFLSAVKLPNGFKVPMRRFVYEDSLIRVGGANNRIIDPGIFDAGLNLSPKDREAILEKKRHDDPGKVHTNLTVSDYLRVREYPILVVYPLKLKGANQKSQDEYNKHFKADLPLLGFAIGFPAKESKQRVNYRINKIKLDELNRNIEIDDEGDEDIDG